MRKPDLASAVSILIVALLLIGSAIWPERLDGPTLFIATLCIAGLGQVLSRWTIQWQVLLPAEEPESEPFKKRQYRFDVFGRIFGLLLTGLYVTVFTLVVQTGYLSPIGVLVGVTCLLPGIFAFVALAFVLKKRRLEGILRGIHGCLPVILGFIAFAAHNTPMPDPDPTWRPLTFDRERLAWEAERAVPDGENAALRYDELLASIDTDDRPDYVFHEDGLLASLSQPWKLDDVPRALHWLDGYTKVIEILLPIGEMELCRWPLYLGRQGEYTVPHEGLRWITYLMTLSAYRDLGEANLDAAIDKSIWLLRHADHLYQQTLHVDFSIGLKVERTALRVLRHVLGSHSLSGEQIERIAAALPSPENRWREDMARLLRFDTYRFVYALGPVYEINEGGKTRFSALLLLDCKGNLTHRNNTKRRWSKRLYHYLNMPLDPNGVWTMAERELAPYAPYIEEGPVFRFEDEYRPLHGPSIDPLRALVNVDRSLAWGISFDVYGSHFSESYARTLTERRGTWLMLGLRRYHDRNNTWPDALESISDDVPTETLHDPSSDDPFVYRREGRGFRLYSKGINQIDEQGRRGYQNASNTLEDDVPIWSLSDQGDPSNP